MGKELVPHESIENKILEIRGQKVMLDSDLAELFGVKTRNINRQVKRNLERFPEEFVFQLSEQEKSEVVPNWHHLSGLRFSYQLPYAFTEHGIAMLATVLKSESAVKMTIFIIKTFVALRKHIVLHKELADKFAQLEDRVLKHDSDIRELVRDIRRLSVSKSEPSGKVGFLKS
jgi:phage regulator Rha-like protein